MCILTVFLIRLRLVWKTLTSRSRQLALLVAVLKIDECRFSARSNKGS